MNPRAFIPSMFHRRLAMLAAFLVVGMIVLVARLYSLTVVHGAELRRDSERALVERNLIPTVRGRILDRNGLVLAYDRPCFDVMVDYRIISGEWAVGQAAAAARQETGTKWDELGEARRQELIDAELPAFGARADAVWSAIAELSETPLEGVIKERDEIERRVEIMAKNYQKRWRAKREKQYQVQVNEVEVMRRRIREQREAHVILRGIDASHEAGLRRFAAEGPQIGEGMAAVTIDASGVREYPWSATDVVLDRSSMPAPLRSSEPATIHVSNIAGLVLGSMRDEVNEEEMAARPVRNGSGDVVDLGGYLPGDDAGGRGLEKSFESVLRGRRGIVVRRLDTDTEERIAPQGGTDVSLAMDIRLTARVQAILAPEFGMTRVQPWHGSESQLDVGTPLNAAVVVIDVESGEILAMAATPTERCADWDGLPEEMVPKEVRNAAWFNRAVGVPYEPGSIVKPLMLCAAVTERVWDLGRSVECRGHFYPNDAEHFRCWIYRAPSFGVHGSLEAVEALARSCNVYFYTVGKALGAERQGEWYRRWGLGRTFDLGLVVFEGRLPEAGETQPGEVLMMGIGNGPVAWTPLHAANAYAAMARGGYYMDPVLVRNDPRPGVERYREDLELSDQAVYTALQGLSEVVNNQEYGGARHLNTLAEGEGAAYEPIFNLPGVKVWGKTGTAQKEPWPTTVLRYTPDGRVVHDAAGWPVVVTREAGIGAHSWFVGLVGPEGGDAHSTRPKYSIAVLVEWGGSGSRCAAPIANQVMQALAAEGYLP